MLVLLVIFMVTAPIIQQGVQVNLPQAKAGAIPGTEELLVVTIAKNGKVYLNDNPMTLGELGDKLRAIRKLQGALTLLCQKLHCHPPSTLLPRAPDWAHRKQTRLLR